jgi:hypothetical protein
MRKFLFPAVFLALAPGCGEGGPPMSDEVVPTDQVPPVVLEAARKQLPGLTFDTVYKMKVGGKDAYEVRGKDKKGKVREVEVSPTGEVLAVE